MIVNAHTIRIERYIREGRTVSGGCGASSGQRQVAAEQQANFQNLSNNAQQEFGDSSQIFQDLTSAFQPILNAGPGQSGYTAPELANLQSQAITTSGQQYRNAATAAGERSAAAGGGNQVLPTGAALNQSAQIAEAGASQTAGELSQINLNNAALGRQNWLAAANVLGGAPGVFGTANQGGQVATGAGSSALQGANAVQSANRQWVGDVMGVLGDAAKIGGGALAGGMFSGGSGGLPGSDSISSWSPSVGGVSDPGLATPGYMPGGGPSVAAPNLGY